jgi:putative oxidoreductase
LALRTFVAWQFLKAGIVKVSNWEGTLSLFREEYTIPVIPPELAAVMGAGGELAFSTLLILGLFSRPAALGLFAVNAMAVISYPQLGVGALKSCSQ